MVVTNWWACGRFWILRAFVITWYLLLLCLPPCCYSILYHAWYVANTLKFQYEEHDEERLSLPGGKSLLFVPAPPLPFWL